MLNLLYRVHVSRPLMLMWDCIAAIRMLRAKHDRKMNVAVRRFATFAEKQYCCYTAVMKATLTLTSRGVVTLPAKLRRALGLKAEDQLIAETTPEGLLLRPAVTLPVEIYSEKRIREFDEAEAELAKVLPRRPAKKSGR